MQFAEKDFNFNYIIYMNALLKFFGYSMTDINFDYDSLTTEEKDLVTREEFNQAVEMYQTAKELKVI